MKSNRCNKVVCNLYGKISYVIHVRYLKQVLNNGLILKKVHRAVQFNQEAWLKKYIDMNTKLRKKRQKNDFEKDFYKLTNNSVFRKTVKNVRNHRYIRLVTTSKRE